jgi:hypothetical protein
VLRLRQGSRCRDGDHGIGHGDRSGGEQAIDAGGGGSAGRRAGGDEEEAAHRIAGSHAIFKLL